MAITTHSMSAVRTDLELDSSSPVSLNDDAVRFRAGVHSGTISLSDPVGSVSSWQSDISPADYTLNPSAPRRSCQTLWASYAPAGGWGGNKPTYSSSGGGIPGQNDFPNGYIRNTCRSTNTAYADKSTVIMWTGVLANTMGSTFSVEIDRMNFHKNGEFDAYDLEIWGFESGPIQGRRKEYAVIKNAHKVSATGLSTHYNGVYEISRKYYRSFVIDINYRYLLIAFQAIWRAGTGSTSIIPTLDVGGVRAYL